MIERRIVRRYASALFGAASKAGVIDQVESDLGLVTYTFESSPELLESIRMPLIPVPKKKEILRDIFGGKVHEITLSYLDLLIEKHREDAIVPTEELYILLANEARGVITVRVESAIELTRDEQSRLIAQLSQVTGKTVQLDAEVVPDHIGGALVRIGDTVIDGTVRGQLAALRETLIG